MNKRVWLVIPTYNESGNVRVLVRRIRDQLPFATILFVDDGSPDGTAAVIKTLTASDPNIELIERSGKLGLGTAYLAGFRRALESDAAVIVQMDADLSHDPVELPVLTRMAMDVDLVIGSRYVQGGSILNWPLHRKVLSRVANQYARAVLGVRIRDVTTGYRSWNARSLERLPLSTIKSNGYAFLTEMIYHASNEGLIMVERPICFRDRTEGVSKMNRREIVSGVRTILSIRRRNSGRRARR